MARKSKNLIFSSTCFVSVWLKLWNIFFVFRRWYFKEFLFRWQLRYFPDKNSLVFVVSLHFFTFFGIFLLPFLSFIESFNQIRTQRKQLRMLFEFYRSALPVFRLFSICFFSFIFTLFFFCIIWYFVYKNDTKFGHIGLPGNRRQNKKITACIVVL